MIHALLTALAPLTPTVPISVDSAQIVAESRPDELPYADLVDRVIAAPAIVDATIRDASRLKPQEAPDLPANRARLYVTADVVGLIRGPANGVPSRITYLADVPLDQRGRPPRLKKARMLLFARAVAGRPGEVQLIAPDAQQAWTPALDARVRTIAREVVATDAPPAITGIGNAFHVAGSLPGEGETQIFLATANGRPVSLSILRRPGEQPRWAVALSEIVDEAAAPPPRETLLWYRLACGLPVALPQTATAAMDPDDAAIASADYRLVRASLGACR